MKFGNGNDLGNMSMLDLFRLETENHCDQLSQDLLALEQDPAAADLLESLMRASHSIKGAARIVERQAAVQIAHAMEDVFVAAQGSKIILDRSAIDLLLTGVDMLNFIARIPEGQTEKLLAEKADTIASLVNSFTGLATGNTTGSQASVAKPDAIPHETPGTPGKPAPASTADTVQLPVDLSNMSMLDLFRMEAEKHCAKLFQDLEALKLQPSDPDRLASLLNTSHAMRGAAMIVKQQEAVSLAHAMEDVFSAARKDNIIFDQNTIASLHKGVELLSAITGIPDADAALWLADHSPAIEQLLTKFKTFFDNNHSVRPAAPVPDAESPGKKPTEISLSQNEPMKPARRADDKNGQRSVRVSAQNMERLLGLAGEAIIESSWLPKFNKELLRLKYRQEDLYTYIDGLREHLQTKDTAAGVIIPLNDLLDKIEICRSMLIQDVEVMDEHARNATRISNRLYTEILTSKMRPFSEGIMGFARMVRDVARELGKEVHYEVIGADTLVDRDILDKIEAPLNHMIRNAVDHGIESPTERNAGGKPVKGTIQLIARHSAGMLSISVRDDGRGIDLENIRRNIVNKKLCPQNIAENLSDHELVEFLFLPNFSTQKGVSEISGRGVGLNVVHSVVNEIRGKILSSTKLHQGTTFELQLPLTLSILKALLIEINGEMYGIPLVAIEHLVQLNQDDIQEIEGRQYFTFNEKRIGIVSGRQLLKGEPLKTASSENFNVIIFSDRFNSYGLTVDKLMGVRDLVVQHLDSRLGKLKDINSAAVLEDGTPVLIIDVEDILNSLDVLISGHRIVPVGIEPGPEQRTKRILVVDDSITVREVERKMLLARGYDVDVAVDGMDAWNTLRENQYDLLVSDIDMPRLNGFELVSLIKKDPHLCKLPVIIVSYKDREEERNRGLEVGADYYLSKGSFHDQALVNAVLDLIGEAHE